MRKSAVRRCAARNRPAIRRTQLPTCAGTGSYAFVSETEAQHRIVHAREFLALQTPVPRMTFWYDLCRVHGARAAS